MKMNMKIEEKDESLVKKEKKHKQEQTSQTKIKKCSIDSGDGNRKKKATRVKGVVKEEECCDVGGELQENKTKKKKKKVVTDSLNDISGPDVAGVNDNGVSKKKIKKKRLADYESQMEAELVTVKEEEGVGGEKRWKKEKKMKHEASQIKPENLKKEKIEEEQEVPKKEKKVRNKTLVASTEETEAQIKDGEKNKNDAEEAGINGRKKKKKAKAKLAENGVILEMPAGESGEAEEAKQKKKKNKKGKTDHDTAANGNGNEVETSEIKSKKKKNNKAASDTDKPKDAIKQEMEVEDDIVNGGKDKAAKKIIVIDEEERELKKKKGKKRKHPEVSIVEETEPAEKKKKKKKKKVNLEGDEPLLPKCEEAEEEEGWSRGTPVTLAGDTSKKSKSKKSSTQVETQETGLKTKKKKKKPDVEGQRESPQVGVASRSERTGNADEVTINQERTQALPVGTDQDSQPQKSVKPSGLGQWSTAQFESSEQQQKFLRLMGGFKKGSQPVLANTGRANMALSKDAEQHLQQGLLGEFERAQSRRMDFNNRGAGLGFAAPSNKKFSIDISACRSVRFDD